MANVGTPPKANMEPQKLVWFLGRYFSFLWGGADFQVNHVSSSGCKFQLILQIFTPQFND